MKAADQIGSYITALTLTGLPYTTGKLMGKAPQPVLRQFEIWGRAGKSGLPRVVRTYWKAIAPLGLTRPSLPGVPVLELILYGQMSDVDVARDAHHAVTLGAKRAMQISGKPPVIEPVVDGLVQELGTAIKQFWRLYARTCDKAREQVINGDLGSAVICVRRNEAQILELIDEIESKSRTIAATIGKTSTGGVDQILGALLSPEEYVQPDLEQLVLYQAPVTPAAPAEPAPEPAQPQAVTEAELHGFPDVPKPEPTGIQTSFETKDEIDEAAAKFATGRMEPIIEEAGVSEVEDPIDQVSDGVEEVDQPKQAFKPIDAYVVEQETQERSAWLGVVFVLLSVAIACGVVWYFLFGSPF